jgi:hypothetical protein
MLPLFAASQNKINLSSSEQLGILKNIQGQYARVKVKMGLVEGTGGVFLGTLLPIKNFGFKIYVLGREDSQFGLMQSMEIETENFEDYLIRIKWVNNIKTQGTLDGEVQILYASRKEKIEAYFISGNDFSIFWWLELTAENKSKINEILTKHKITNVKYLNMKKQEWRETEIKRLKFELEKLDSEILIIKQEIDNLNSKIRSFKSN